MDMQKLMDLSSKAGAAEAVEQGIMTLGHLIDVLVLLDPYLPIRLDDGYPGRPHSYRGYYVRLAFERTDEPQTVGSFLEIAKDCLGETFEGYKGGNFMMHRGSLLHAALYGCCGRMIVGVERRGDEVHVLTAEEVF